MELRVTSYNQALEVADYAQTGDILITERYLPIQKEGDGTWLVMYDFGGGGAILDAKYVTNHEASMWITDMEARNLTWSIS